MLRNTQSRCPTSPLMTDAASGLRVYNPSKFFSSPRPSYKCDLGCRASVRAWMMRLEQKRVTKYKVYLKLVSARVTEILGSFMI